MPTSNTLLLVTGASGPFGKLVVHHLLTTFHVSPTRIVAGTRDPSKLQELADKGVQVRKIDFNDLNTVTKAATGVERALLVSTDEFLHRETAQIAAVEAFVKACVKHIAYTSLQGADKSIFAANHSHLATEEAIKASTGSYTLLRNGLYFENNLGWIAGALKTGQWFTAAKDGKASLLSRDDLARAAAFVLSSDSTENHVYELTGSEALTIDEIADQVSKSLKKPIEVVHVSVEELANTISETTGLPAFAGKLLATLDASTAAGLASDVTGDFEKLMGVMPRTHREWLEANKTFLLSL
ncbi:hypothetical protein Poli38472_012645 [Pythium oligandrum]|uniref:NmrA-like domain-containing protein n=1 Tax=Pythium oligandrum TaxID=41045 RepID=A0A8K1FHW6_PYTOL|nr:hypothetical protein Poli38472_012645 [Pythium oligandrum]|eukprot:TMW61454.1 hypothetical protein Poli38472_012645 [Pythium oligandrum]